MTKDKQNYNIKTILTFIIPSLIGLFLFMVPISYNNELTIPVAVLANQLKDFLSDSLLMIITAIVIFTAIATLITKLFKPKFIRTNSFLNSLLNVNIMWVIVRIIGAIFIFMTFFNVGLDVVVNGDTGLLVMNDLLPVLFSVFFFAGLLLPLLLNFGLLELLGSLFMLIMRPLFNLPGRSAIDCIASWLGDGSVGILLTSKQYENRFYTQREAAVIGTTFSAVSITFSLVVIQQVSLEHLFVPFYFTVCAAGFVAAIIVPKLPPLSRKLDNYIDGTPRNKNDELYPKEYNALTWGFHQALNKAAHCGSIKTLLSEGVKNVVDMIFGVIPVVMGIGTIALIVQTNTSFFDYLAIPFQPLLELFQVPEAAAAAKTIMVGFADMFLPAILATDIQSDMTRFIIAALSVTQLIYMSEVGALLLGSKIPIKFWELFVIFILRTLVTLPVIIGLSHLIF